MRAIDGRLVSFDDVLFEDECDVSCEFPQRIFLGKLFYIMYGRNAWHNTTIGRYYSDSFHLQMCSAECSVNGNRWKRTQGSYWTIKELPCLVFQADQVSLLITEINTTLPLLRYSPNLEHLHLASLYSNAMWFRPTGPNSVIRLLTTDREIEAADGNWRVYRSRSRGGGSELEWWELRGLPSTTIINAGAVKKMADQLAIALAGAGTEDRTQEEPRIRRVV